MLGFLFLWTALSLILVYALNVSIWICGLIALAISLILRRLMSGPASSIDLEAALRSLEEWKASTSYNSKLVEGSRPNACVGNTLVTVVYWREPGSNGENRETLSFSNDTDEVVYTFGDGVPVHRRLRRDPQERGVRPREVEVLTKTLLLLRNEAEAEFPSPAQT